MQQAFVIIEYGLSMFEFVVLNTQRFKNIMGLCYKAFGPYNVILVEKKVDSSRKPQPAFEEHRTRTATASC